MTHVLRLTASKYTAAVLVIALLIQVSSLTAAEPSVHSEHVAGNVHVIFGPGGNIGVLVTERGVILVDDQFAPLTESIQAALWGA